jgi:hypothetical protein
MNRCLMFKTRIPGNNKTFDYKSTFSAKKTEITNSVQIQVEYNISCVLYNEHSSTSDFQQMYHDISHLPCNHKLPSILYGEVN